MRQPDAQISQVPIGRGRTTGKRRRGQFGQRRGPGPLRRQRKQETRKGGLSRHGPSEISVGEGPGQRSRRKKRGNQRRSQSYQAETVPG